MGCQHSPSQTLRRAIELCAERKVKLTEQRRRVLEIICHASKPLGAYEVLDELRKTTPQAKPPTAYRALDFLQQQGLIHKLETLHAFIGCHHPDHPHHGQFLICTGCGAVTELEDSRITQSIRIAVDNSGFHAETGVVEIQGKCAGCHPHEP
ncbi:MAG: transcriptional repressor [bacterium]